MGEVVPARTSPTLHPPSPPTVHQLSRLALEEFNNVLLLAGIICMMQDNFIHIIPIHLDQGSIYRSEWLVVEACGQMEGGCNQDQKAWGSIPSAGRVI